MSAIIRAANPSNRRKLDTNSSVAPKKAVKTGRLSFIVRLPRRCARRVLEIRFYFSRHGMPRPRRRAAIANALRARRRRHRARQRSGQPPRAARQPPSAPGPPTTRAGLQLVCSAPAIASVSAAAISRRARRVRMLGAARTSTRAPIGRRLVRTATSHHHCSRISTIVQPVREAWGRVQPLVRCGNGGVRRRRHVGPFGRELEFIAMLSRPLL